MPKSKKRDLQNEPNRNRGPARQPRRFQTFHSTGLLGFSAFTDDQPEEDALKWTIPGNPELDSHFRKLTKKNNLSRIKALQWIQNYVSSGQDSNSLSYCWPRAFERLSFDPDETVRAEAVKLTSLLAQRGYKTNGDLLLLGLLITSGDLTGSTAKLASKTIVQHEFADFLDQKTMLTIWNRIVELGRNHDRIYMLIGALSKALAIRKPSVETADILRIVDHPLFLDLIKNANGVLTVKMVELTKIIARDIAIPPRLVKLIVTTLLTTAHSQEWAQLLLDIQPKTDLWTNAVDVYQHLMPSFYKVIKSSNSIKWFFDLVSNFLDSRKIELPEFVKLFETINQKILSAIEKDNERSILGFRFMAWAVKEFSRFPDAREIFSAGLDSIILKNSISIDDRQVKHELMAFKNNRMAQTILKERVFLALDQDYSNRSPQTIIQSTRSLLEWGIVENPKDLAQKFSDFLQAHLTNEIASILSKWNTSAIWELVHLKIEDKSEDQIRINTRQVLFSNKDPREIELSLRERVQLHPETVTEDIVMLVKLNKSIRVNILEIVEIKDLLDESILLKSALEASTDALVSITRFFLTNSTEDRNRATISNAIIRKLMNSDSSIVAELVDEIEQISSFVINNGFLSQLLDAIGRTEIDNSKVVRLLKACGDLCEANDLDRLCERLSLLDLVEIPKSAAAFAEQIGKCEDSEVFEKVIRLMSSGSEYESIVSRLPAGIITSKIRELVGVLSVEKVDLCFRSNPALFEHSNCADFQRDVRQLLDHQNAFSLAAVIAHSSKQVQCSCGLELWRDLMRAVAEDFPDNYDPERILACNLLRARIGFERKEESSANENVVTVKTLRIGRILNKFDGIKSVQNDLLARLSRDLLRSIDAEFLIECLRAINQELPRTTSFGLSELALSLVEQSFLVSDLKSIRLSVETMSFLKAKTVDEARLSDCERKLASLFYGQLASDDLINDDDYVNAVCEYFDSVDPGEHMNLFLSQVNDPDSLVLKYLLEKFRQNLQRPQVCVLLVNTIIAIALSRKVFGDSANDELTATTIVKTIFNELDQWHDIMLESKSEQDLLDSSVGFVILVHAIIVIFSKCSSNRFVVDRVSHFLHSNDFASKFARAVVGVLDDDCLDIGILLMEIVPGERLLSVRSLKFPTESNLELLERSVVRLLYDALVNAPKLIRELMALIGGSRKKSFCSIVSYYFSPVILTNEINALKKLMTQSECKDDDDEIALKIVTDLANRFVRVHLDIGTPDPVGEGKSINNTALSSNDCKLEFEIQFPVTYPIEPYRLSHKPYSGTLYYELDCRQWSMAMMLQSGDAGGMSLYRSLSQLKKNVKKKIEGSMECVICLYVLHNITNEIPEIECYTCNKMYHRLCINAWFNEAPELTCPHCRSEFFSKKNLEK